MRAVGIDIGTTTISAAVVDTESRKTVWTQTVPNGSFLPTEHSWERIQDMGQIVVTAKEVLDEILGRYGDIEAIGLTGQMHGCLYLDPDGRCISPLYTWQDGRGDLPDKAGEGGKSLREELAARCGVSVPSGYGLVTHLYNERKGLVPAHATSLCTAADYLGMVLTGRRQPLLHGSMAASLGFFDVQKGQFDAGILDAVGICRSILPAVTGPVDVLGRYRGVPVSVALGDHQAAFLGAVGRTVKGNEAEGADRAATSDRPAGSGSTISINMGTGGQISVLTDRYMEICGIETRPFLDGCYLLAGASLCGGRAYAALERFFRSYVTAAGGADRPQYAVMAKLAEKGLASGKRLEVATTFRGTRTDPKLRGSIRGIGEEDLTPEALICGVLYGMAQELYAMYEKIQEGTGEPVGHIVASGNSIRKNPVLQQIVCRLFQAELTLAPCEEEAAYGAACSSVDELLSRSNCWLPDRKALGVDGSVAACPAGL